MPLKQKPKYYSRWAKWRMFGKSQNLCKDPWAHLVCIVFASIHPRVQDGLTVWKMILTIVAAGGSVGSKIDTLVSICHILIQRLQQQGALVVPAGLLENREVARLMIGNVSTWCLIYYAHSTFKIVWRLCFYGHSLGCFWWQHGRLMPYCIWEYQSPAHHHSPVTTCMPTPLPTANLHSHQPLLHPLIYMYVYVDDFCILVQDSPR